MTTSPADDHRAVAGRFTALVENVPDDGAWDRPSPVPEWTARDVVRHLVTWFPDFLHGGAGVTLPPGPSVDDDPAGAWRTLAVAVQELLDDPGERILRNPHIGEMPLTDAIARFFTTDVFMHTWDLARATGQDETLDPQRCADLLEALLPMDEILRASGQYGPAVDVGPDTDVQTRMLAFIGRDPRTPTGRPG